MKIKEISPKLQLNMDEYAETWCSVITSYYWKGLEPDITDKELHLSDEGILKYSMELAAVELVIAIRVLKNRIRLNDEIQKKLTDTIIGKLYTDLYSEAKLQFKEDFISFFNSKYDIFNEVCTNLADKDAKKRQPELIGLARYIVAQISDSPEKQNVKVIEKLSLIFMDTAATCLRLAQNSACENPILGKTKFIVQK